ncbi:MAG: DUF2914 domain-containing protein [Acidobacteriia bacterium]|nr:DUF2914 domain-containing protein [Terriglobia bacterium]
MQPPINYRQHGPGPVVQLNEPPVSRVGRFLRAHGRRLWWLHSVYALAIGTGVVAFASQGFGHARFLAITLAVAWLLLVLLFRVRDASGAPHTFDAADPKTRVRFFVVTYALKNLYQGMLFFLLPFYWKATTTDAANAVFVAVLAACAVLSTLDIVFDRVLMRRQWLASAFHGFALFACMNLVIPALLPDTRTLWSLLGAAGCAVVSFWTLHVTAVAVKKRITLAYFALSLASGFGVVYAARVAIPPVPMYVSSAGVGPEQLPDGRLAMEVTTLHPSVIQELIAVTDVVVPGGKGDRLRHVWRHEGSEVHRTSEETARIAGPAGVVRLRSTLRGEDLPRVLDGRWWVDVETDDGQLVGRTKFEVAE